MASSGDNDEYKWPNSGQDGPDVEWEHVPIEIPGPISWPPIPEMAEIPTIFPPISPETEDQPPEDTKEEEAKVPTVEEYMKLEGAEGEDESLPTTPLRRPKIQIPPSPLTPLSQSPPPLRRPKIQVSTLERYYPSPQEVNETYPDNLDELFDKHGDELIIQDDENGKTMHIFFLFGEYEDKKHYRCIRKGCNSFLVVEEIPKPHHSRPTPGPGGTRKIPKEDPPQDQQKVRTPKGKEEKEEADEDPKEGCSKEDQKVMKVMKVQSFSSKGIQKLYK